MKNNSDNSPDTAVDNDANNVECLFDYCISNPPYQKKTGKSENSKITYKRVYDAFQYYASSMAKDTVMIYPSFWLNNVRRGLGAWLKDNGIAECYTYEAESIFGNAIRKDYKISIVSTKKASIDCYNLLL